MPPWQTFVPAQSSSLEQAPLHATRVPGGFVGCGVELSALVGSVVGVVPGTFVGVGDGLTPGTVVGVGDGLTPGTLVGVGDGLTPGAVVGVGDGLTPGHKQSTSPVHEGFRQTPTSLVPAIKHVIPDSQSLESLHHPSQLFFATAKVTAHTNSGVGVAEGALAACG